MKNFGEAIRARRLTLGLTQQAVAHAVGVDLSYISKLENNRAAHTPSPRTLVALAHALETDELELMRLAGKLPPSLEALAAEPEAIQALSVIRTRVASPAGWRRLAEYVESPEFEASLGAVGEPPAEEEQ